MKRIDNFLTMLRDGLRFGHYRPPGQPEPRRDAVLARPTTVMAVGGRETKVRGTHTGARSRGWLVRGNPIPWQRRHTLLFLKEIRAAAPVFLQTDVDMSRVLAHRAAASQVGRRYSLVSYILHAAARVLAAHPDANAAIRGRLRPRIARYPGVHAKLTLDKTLQGQRAVFSGILHDLQDASMEEVQAKVDYFREGDPSQLPEFAATRVLDRLPGLLRVAAFRSAVRPLSRRPASLGTFAVTSLGHRPVDQFYSVGGTTITLGLGRVLDRPVVRDGQLAIAPVMRLCLTFDHRVIDGAEAADVLADITSALQTFASNASVTVPVAEATLT